MLSIILPAYNEENNIDYACDEIFRVLNNEQIAFEIVFVDDGSKDETWKQVLKEAEKRDYVHGVSFSRNFGKEAAIIAGLSFAKGDCCVVMDCDMQHPSQSIAEMYHLWESGYDVVEGIKATRGEESFFHKKAAGTFYSLISKVTGIDMSRASDFKLMDRKVVETLLSMPEKELFFRAVSSWVGYKKTKIEFDVQERISGESKWSTKALIKYAITNITSFSSMPMQMVTGMGILYLTFAVIMFLQTMMTYLSGKAMEGFSTVIILILLTGSLIMLSLGILGYYVARVYDEVKGRPRYIIARKI